MALTGNVIVQEWTVLDNANAPLTGVTTPAGITFTLHRQSGATIVSASETISWTEILATGHYYIAFTPQNAGLYVLQLLEIHASSQQRAYRFDFLVYTAGSAFVPSYTEAFCSESDVERWLQQPITSSTRPSSTEAAAFAEGRAAMLMGLTAALGYGVTPTTVASGSRLEDLLREANAIGAALDFTVAQTFGTGPSKTDRATWLDDMWASYYGAIVEGARVGGMIELEIRGNLASLATDHILSGDTLAPATTAAPTSVGITVTMGDLF